MFASASASFRQITRYSIAGAATVALDFVTLYALTEYLHVFYLLSATLSFVVALLFNYAVSLYWVFDERDLTGRWSLFLQWVFVNVLALVVNAGLIWVLTEIGRLYYLASKALASLVIFVWNYYSRRYLLRRARVAQQRTADPS